MKIPIPGVAAGTLAVCLAGCGSSTGPSDELPARPVPLSPIGGIQVTSDTPTFTVRNAKGYDAGQSSYTFQVRSEDGTREFAALTVAAGLMATSATPATPLPRGRVLAWTVSAANGVGEVTSDPATFRSNAVLCISGRDPYAKTVVDWFVPACSLAQNRYNDPQAVLGPPDAGGKAPDQYFGFMSLGEKGYVTVDMEACAVDQAGADVRIFQTTSKEPVTLYASGAPNGPWELLESRKPCGDLLPGVYSRYCEFDLAAAGIEEARYFKIEDGEHYPCELGTTVTEGADIDSIQILHVK